MKFEWFVASRYLRSRRKQSFISLISIISIGGVALGVATVILAIAVLNGVEHGLKERFLANEAHVVLMLHGSEFFGGASKRIGQIEKLDEVVAASPVVYSQVAVFPEHSKRIQDVIHIKGIEPAKEEAVTGFTQFVVGSVDFQDSPLIAEAERLSDNTITGGIVLGVRLADRLGIVKGDILRLVVELQEHPINPDTFIPDLSNFVVIGLYESELAVYDNSFGFIHIEAAQKLYNKANRINAIFVRLIDAELAPQAATRIEKAVEFSVLEGFPMTRTWMEVHAPLFAALRLEKTLTVVIEALIILVAAFNIASTLIMTVMEKTRDVGTLRTLGSSRGSVMGIFMIQGSVIGLLGTLLGTGLGLTLCWLLSSNSVRPSPWWAFIVAAPVLCQVLIALRRMAPHPNGFKTALVLFWVAAFGFGLYCLVKPISLAELGLSQIYQMNQLPIKVNWFFVGFINALSFLICWLATLYPAWQAANLNPVEALQHE